MQDLDRKFATSPLTNWALVIIALAIALYWSVNPSDIPLQSPDSTSYIRFDDYRGAGYPALLALLHWLTGSLDYIVELQLLLVVLSTAFLAIRFTAFCGSAIAGLILLLTITMNPFFMRYCFSILSEALFFSSLMLFLAIAVERNRPASRTFILLGMCLAWLVLIKPVAWAFISIPVLLAVHSFLRYRQFVRPILTFSMGVILIIALGAMYRHSVHGVYSPGSFLGNQLAGKLIFAEFDAKDIRYPEAGQKWLNYMEIPKQVRTEAFQDLDEKFLFSINIYDYIRFVKSPHIVAAAGPGDQSVIQGELARSILFQDPGAFVEDVGLQLYGLWTMATLQPAGLVERYMEKVSIYQPRMPVGVTLYAINGRVGWMVIALKGGFYLLCGLSLACILAGLYHWLVRRKAMNQTASMLFYLSAAIHSYYLLVATFQAALPRYLFAGWPILVMLALILTLWVTRFGCLRSMDKIN
ncbi:MAG: hypothetical protein ACI8P9_000180 [Parasphingorhabdus sp.]|jgi:hypothetical protein